jgi:hypothetical protein
MERQGARILRDQYIQLPAIGPGDDGLFNSPSIYPKADHKLAGRGVATEEGLFLLKRTLGAIEGEGRKEVFGRRVRGTPLILAGQQENLVAHPFENGLPLLRLEGNPINASGSSYDDTNAHVPSGRH